MTTHTSPSAALVSRTSPYYCAIAHRGSRGWHARLRLHGPHSSPSDTWTPLLTLDTWTPLLTLGYMDPTPHPRIHGPHSSPSDTWTPLLTLGHMDPTPHPRIHDPTPHPRTHEPHSSPSNTRTTLLTLGYTDPTPHPDASKSSMGLYWQVSTSDWCPWNSTTSSCDTVVLLSATACWEVSIALSTAA